MCMNVGSQAVWTTQQEGHWRSPTTLQRPTWWSRGEQRPPQGKAGPLVPSSAVSKSGPSPRWIGMPGTSSQPDPPSAIIAKRLNLKHLGYSAVGVVVRLCFKGRLPNKEFVGEHAKAPKVNLILFTWRKKTAKSLVLPNPPRTPLPGLVFFM